MTVIEMSEQELTRLRVSNDLSDRRLAVEAAARLMGVGRSNAPEHYFGRNFDGAGEHRDRRVGG
jgi:hypothetical protein